MIRGTILTILISITATGLFGQKFEDLAKTPPMGWNSWNRFGCDVTEKLIRETADAMVSSGMKDAGYTYVVIDDCWHGERDSLGFIHPDPERFPSGMKALADYIHSQGLKFGIYSDAGTKTCGGRPGSRGFEYQDAITYASWDVDYLKYDWCNTSELNAKEAYTTMRDALYRAGRPVVFSICEWGDNKPWLWAKDIGHLWRTTGDIYHCWECEWNHGIWSSWGMLNIIDMQKDLRKYAGPGHWNDPDMMEVGNGMTVNEDRAHFSMWCMLAAPLIAGNDLVSMTKETVEILTNKEAIAVNQDELGIQGYKMLDYGDLEIWVKPLKNMELAFCFLNRGKTPQTIEYDWKKIPIEDALSNCHIDFNKTTYKVRDLWAKENLGTTNEKFKAIVPAHDVIMLGLTK
ncbi:MAG: glycoside hydrolase family 27 protein [Bacteroidales bacterium]|nr:glycoside hydrolase family 27 protein [Bacteroidales bacterium]